MKRALFLGLLVACAPSTEDDVTEPGEPQPAPLAELTDGDCPDLSGGLATFSSAGLERTVNVVLPDVVEPGMPVIFTFHGLMTPEQDPVGNTVRGFRLKVQANQLGAIFVVPQARAVSLPLVGEVSLWGILDDEEPDLALYDDLRTCLATELDVDLTRVSSWGHSGGALWTSVLAIERSDTLAAIAEFSGGANVSILNGDFIQYAPSDTPVPAMLSSGGEGDVWPDPTFTIIDFQAATDSLAASMSDHGHTVVRCQHDQGHFTIPSDGFPFAMQWLLEHRFGEPMAFVERRRDEVISWCWVEAEPAAQR